MSAPSARGGPSTPAEVLHQLDGLDSARLLEAMQRLTQTSAPETARLQGQTPQSDQARNPWRIQVAIDNGAENRYMDIVSYDHALLPGPYLNASLISPWKASSSTPGVDVGGSRAYIASQAPIPSTFATFYQHIFEERVDLLVNLTPLTEAGRVKAERYWPLRVGERMPVGGGWTVELDQMDDDDAAAPSVAEAEAAEASWELTRRELLVRPPPSSAAAVSSEPHRVTQLHLTSWSDHAADSDASFERIIQLVRRHPRGAGQKTAPPPVWVHCSAGVGRSGTLIAALLAHDAHDAGRLAAEAATQGGAQTGKEAALRTSAELVAHMRTARPRMVQTPAQLRMVVRVVEALLRGPSPTTTRSAA